MLSIRLLTLASTLILSTSSYATMMFSEYVEGSSFNKALEIYNSGEDVDFDADQYAIEIYSNGSSTASFKINLSGVLQNKSTFVIGHSKSENAILSVANQISGSLNFNGDDAITLLHNGAIIDSIGQIGLDPGTEWGVDSVSTQNNTLRRLPDILSGDNNAFDGFDPNLQWVGFDQDTVGGLGQHQIFQETTASEPDLVSVPLPGTLLLFLTGLFMSGLPGFVKSRQLFVSQQI